jgi:hypothetical protein
VRALSFAIEKSHLASGVGGGSELRAFVVELHTREHFASGRRVTFFACLPARTARAEKLFSSRLKTAQKNFFLLRSTNTQILSKTEDKKVYKKHDHNELKRKVCPADEISLAFRDFYTHDSQQRVRFVMQRYGQFEKHFFTPSFSRLDSCFSS